MSGILWDIIYIIIRILPGWIKTIQQNDMKYYHLFINEKQKLP